MFFEAKTYTRKEKFYFNSDNVDYILDTNDGSVTIFFNGGVHLLADSESMKAIGDIK